MKWAGFPKGCVPAVPVNKASRSCFETYQRVFWWIWVMTQRGISLHRVLAATLVPLISPVRKPLLLRVNWADADAEAGFVTAPDASGEPRPKSERGIVCVVSFNHRFKPLSGTVCRTLWNVVGYFAVSCLFASLTPPDAKVCHRWGQRVASMSWNQDLCCHDDNINWSKDR